MSSRSNNSRSAGAVTAGVVALLQCKERKDQKDSQQPAATQSSAKLLSVRQHLRYKACLALDESFLIRFETQVDAEREFVSAVRSLLQKEFGFLRIHRHRQLLVVSHHCVESLIAGLLRVQFHARQLAYPACRQSAGKEGECTGIALSWGVGESLADAETARKRKISAN